MVEEDNTPLSVTVTPCDAPLEWRLSLQELPEDASGEGSGERRAGVAPWTATRHAARLARTLQDTQVPLALRALGGADDMVLVTGEAARGGARTKGEGWARPSGCAAVLPEC